MMANGAGTVKKTGDIGLLGWGFFRRIFSSIFGGIFGCGIPQIIFLAKTRKPWC